MTSSQQIRFLDQLDFQLQKHLADDKLSVRRLTRLVGMSRSDLHRKLTATVGMSTTAYMRKFRLQKAAELLVNQPEWSIYQIALEVGFSSQSYFSRRFKEVFGQCPAEWRSGKMDLEHM